jgi:release factor glutamine methyltransferase
MAANTNRTASPWSESEVITDRLRQAGCVFAAEEAAVLREYAGSATELDEWCDRREAGEPLEHIVGRVGFGGLTLSVGPGVFVPRQRSWLLARTTIAAVLRRRDQVVLEAFCGVAPIASAVGHAAPGLDIHVADIDDMALAYAEANLRGRAVLHHGPGFTCLPEALRGRIDVIAAVAPYVPATASGFLPREALDHEPHRALFGGVDGLDHINGLVDGAPEWLSANGLIFLEMHRDQVPAVSGYAGRSGFTVETVVGDDRQTAVVGMHRVR